MAIEKFNKENLKRILNYNLDTEINHFEELFDLELPKDVDEAIAFCEKNGYINHIAYNLLLLKKELGD